MPETISRRGPGAAGDHPDRSPGAERIAAEVVIFEPEMRDQRQPVARQNVGRVKRRLRGAAR